MSQDSPAPEPAPVVRPPWWKSIGPALITACVVFGPGSLVISSNIGAEYRYELLWMLLLTGLLMGTYLTMSARVAVAGGASAFTLLARELGRPFAGLVGVVLCLTCAAFQFSNNLAVAAAVEAISPQSMQHITMPASIVLLNFVLITFFIGAREVYRALERLMKFMVAVVLISFLFSMFMSQPKFADVVMGFVPSLPEAIELGVPRRIEGQIDDPMILIASLLGTTFSVAGAFFQGNLVREKGWKLEDYDRGIGDAIAGVCVLTGVSLVIMITAATAIPGRQAENIGDLAIMLQPLLGAYAFPVFCIGLLAVAMNPFLINAMIGGTALADGLGKPARLSDVWPRTLTIAVLLLGMFIALAALTTGERPVNLIIFGQALTVIGNPLMAGSLLYLANRHKVMGDRRNTWLVNILGSVGFLVVLLMAIRVLWRIVLQLT